jgi:hypothetical protein
MLEHQAAFMDALRGGREMRRCIFDTIEQRHAHDFRNSSLGPGLYEHLLSAVRESGAREAIKEFEARFFPLLNSDPSEEMTNQDRVTAVAAQRGRWGLIPALFVVAFAGALIVGFNAVKITAAEATRATAKQTASETTSALAVAPEGPIAATKTIEPASEMPTEEVPALSAEQEPSRAE